jgi:tetratricopeptide (TPR) repeat protein
MTMSSADSYHVAARTKFDEGEFPEAVALCRQGLLLDPDHPGLLQISGVSYYELGEWEDSLADLEGACSLAPLSSISQLVLAAIYSTKCRQPETALAIYEFLAEPGRCPTPLLPEVARGLGELGAYPQAFRACLRMIELRPGLHQAQFGAAFYMVRMGTSAEQVLPHLRRAFELSPATLSYRVSLAMLCAQIGQVSEAYELLRIVPPEKISCSDCLRRMVSVLTAAGDEHLAEVWRKRLAQMESSSEEMLGGLP